MAKSKKDKKKRKKPKPGALTAKTADKHILYEESVQCVEADVDFFRRTFKSHRKRPLRTLKEDFCGTSALACDFVSRHRENRAWGVDLDRPTLDWGIEHHVSRLGAAADRVTLIEDNVLHVTEPKVDLVAALNFSFQIFKERNQLLEYFRKARASLVEDGMFVLDVFGGTDAMEALEEDRSIDPVFRDDGIAVPAFTYVWEQAKFNVVDNHILCHIHFKFRDKTRIRKAFTYDWRLYSIPELTDLLRDAGFARTEVYLEGWDDEADESDGVFRRRTQYENMPGWIGYVIGLR